MLKRKYCPHIKIQFYSTVEPEMKNDCYYIGVVFSFNRPLSLDHCDDFEGNANISVAIKSGSTVSDN